MLSSCKFTIAAVAATGGSLLGVLASWTAARMWRYGSGMIPVCLWLCGWRWTIATCSSGSIGDEDSDEGGLLAR